MSTVTASTEPFVTVRSSPRTPAPVSAVSRVFLGASPRSYASFATQRMPLPHISDSLPSAFHIRIRTSALSLGRIRMSPSLPTPKRRSLTAFAIATGSSTRWWNPST